MDFTEAELDAALRASRDLQRRPRDDQARFARATGFEYFYMDGRLDVWRCEARCEPPGSVVDFDHLADDRSHCTARIMSCHRDTTVLTPAGAPARRPA